MLDFTLNSVILSSNDNLFMTSDKETIVINDKKKNISENSFTFDLLSDNFLG